MKGQAKVHKVMSEFKEGTLRSGSKHGPRVGSRKQAVAIAMSEAGLSWKKKRKNPSAPFGKDGVFSAGGRIGVK